MNEMLNDFASNISPHDIANILINLNRIQLDKKEHIKKYRKIRKLHQDIENSMATYIFDRKYDANKYFDIVKEDVLKEAPDLDMVLDTRNEEDIILFVDLFVYNNHKKISSVTDIYQAKRILRNEEKLKMIESMKNSYVGLFKIVRHDRENGYVFYEDIFTHKKYKIVDISLSSTLNPNEKITRYIYTRIITYEGISFGTGMAFMFTEKDKEIRNFIKRHRYNNCSDFARSLLLYQISKKIKI